MIKDLGFGCAVLFGLPFVGAGAVILILGIRRAIEGDFWQGLIFTPFGLVFAGAGTLLIWGAIGGRRLMAERDALQARYPGEPWRWRSEWAGAIKDATRPGTFLLWIFAGLWNAVAITASVAALPRELAQGNRAAWFILLFPAVGLALLVAAIRATIRLRKFGVSTLTLDTLPGVIGHHIAGTVIAGPALDARQAVELTLTSIRRVTTGSGRSRSTSETILWQDTRTSVPSERWVAGVAIPFRFALPADVVPSDDTRPGDQVIWRLRATAPVPGVDFDATFEVPVFRTPESGRPPSAEEAREFSPAGGEGYTPPTDSPIRVTASGRGTEVDFPAARNPGVAAGLTVFFALWTGVLAFIVHLKAPIVFPIAFGLFDLVLLAWVMTQWFGASQVVAERGTIRFTSGLFGGGRTRTLEGDAMGDIRVSIGGQAGSAPFYQIQAVASSGRKATLGGWIRDKREAEWVASRIREAVGAKKKDE